MGKGLRRFLSIRGFAKAGAVVLLLWLALVGVLGISYLVLPPVSTLMLARWATLQQVDRRMVDIDAISPSLVLAVISAEDARFCEHSGVDWDALRDVVEDADEDGPSRGASTISMQTAKNLFLWPSRSYLRKGLELPLALGLDLLWSKRRMMEVYLNVAEWGEGVFGAEAASRRFFQKSARDLSAREAALLVVALPNPLQRNVSRPTPRHRVLAERLLGRMGNGAQTACVRG